MNYKREKQFYKRNIKISFSISLLLIIIFFLFIPKLNIKNKQLVYFEEPVITLIDIPATKFSNSLLPKVDTKLVTENLNIDEPVILPDVLLNENYVGLNSEQISTNTVNENSNKLENSGFYYLPQQIVEVIPVNKNKIKGQITLELIIDSNGKVKKYKILKSDIDSNEISYLIEQIKKSEWENVLNTNAEFRIVKTYSFQ
ncbi:MAG: hypothetical protein N2249_08550 [Melioribacter sp.]|nr:hypothetical protein [Melioribacter sp.]